MIYLDLAATTPVRREVIEAMWPYLTSEFGNPSSQHELGFGSAQALVDARRTVARLLGTRESRVVFTSGGTEADNLAVKGIGLANPRGRHVITSAIEHPAVIESCRYLQRFHGFRVTALGVDSQGLVDLAALADALTEDTTLVSVMYANNEVGTVQPIEQVVALAGSHGVPVHTDAVQAAASFALNLTELGVDALSISGHKLGAPKGVGVLATSMRVELEPTIHGGGQEGELRSGTENVAGAVALATALEYSRREHTAGTDGVDPLAAWRERTMDFIGRVLAAVPDAVLTGHPTNRLPGHASFCFPGTSGESVLLGLGESGIACSSGSACVAGKDDPSPVLLAMGFQPEVAQTAVRFTFGIATTVQELGQVADAVAATVSSLRSRFR